MKIIFVAVFSYNSTNVSQADGFRKNGCEVIEFNYREIAGKVGNHERDKQLVALCEAEKPDVVVFSKCNEIYSWVVDECNKHSKTVLWYMDPLNDNFNYALKEKIQKCTYSFCALQEPLREAKRIGGNKVFFLHEGYDHTSNYPVDIPYKYNYSFIGDARAGRKKYVDALNISLIQNAYGKEHSIAVSETKINLNFTEGGTSDRTYKVLASKGFLLTEPWDGMEDDFSVGEDLDIFTTVEELRQKIDYYLKNDDERLIIAEHGYQTVRKFDRINWAKKIINKL